MSTAGESWHCAGAEVEVVSKVGAGDTFVGAFTLAEAWGMALRECLRFGVAGASAACATEATKLCDLAMVDVLIGGCTLTRL